MPRSIRSRTVAIVVGVLLLGLAVAIVASFRTSGASHVEHAGSVEQFEPYVDYLHEFTERRRANIYFDNEQSIFYGALFNFVNTKRGNLTFVRRDLATPGRMPLMLARAYDSSGRGSVEFGPRWHLTATETIEIQGHLARLFSETGAEIEFVRAGDGFVPAKDYPSDYILLVNAGDRQLLATLQTGLTKEFTKIGDRYRLTRVADRNGNYVRLHYQGNLLKRLENQSYLIELVRGKSGRVIEARDGLNRKVSYRYSEKGLLAAVADLGGNVWAYQYAAEDRLHKALDPSGRENFKVWHRPDGRVRELELPSGSIRYTYDEDSTTVHSRKGSATRLFHNEEGITTRIVNPLGEETRIVLDAGRNVQQLWENGRLAEEMEYDNKHRIILRRSYKQGNEITRSYFYDLPHGQLTRIERSDGATVQFAYDERSNLVGVTDAHGSRSYEYSASGDVTAVARSGRTISFDVNADGLVVGMNEGSNSRTAMQYTPAGSLAEIAFADGKTAWMTYDALGLRRELRYSDGRRIEYTYDPSGNMLRIDLHKLDGTKGGQLLELDGSYQVRRQILAEGIEIMLEYDKHGNLVESREGERVVGFEYDALDRLTAVVTPTGQRLEYTYAPGEPSLIRQMDHYTGSAASLRRDTGWTFSASRELFGGRADFSQFGSVRFDDNLKRFTLSGPNGYEISTRAEEVDGPLSRLRLVVEGTHLHERQRDFQAPSNLMFLPAEYAAINCCPICAYGPDAPPCEPCYEDPPPPLPPDPIPTFTLTCDKQHLALGPTAPASTKTGQCTASDPSPAGGNFSWSVSKNTLTLSATTGTSINYTAANQSTSVGDTFIDVTYTVNNLSASMASPLITVHKPNSLSAISDSTNPSGQSCTVKCLANPGSGTCSATTQDCQYSSYLRTRQYSTLDQFGNRFVNVGISSVVADESLTTTSSTCQNVNFVVRPPVSTPDFFDDFWLCHTCCLTGGPGCGVSRSQTITVNGITVRQVSINYSCSGVSLNP